MLQRSHRPSPALVISLVALFVALGGTTYAATGGNFILGHGNKATSQSGLTSNNAGKTLNLTQQSTNAAATALSLNVPAGLPPMTVNSGMKVVNLNADMVDGIDSTGLATKTQEAWREVGTPGQPQFATESAPGNPPLWGNWGGGNNTVAFYKDSIGEVHLKGLVSALTNSLSSTNCDNPFSQYIFQLPVGYRPAATAIFPNVHSNLLGRIDVLNNGQVSICRPSNWNTSDFFSLDGISFRAEG